MTDEQRPAAETVMCGNCGSLYPIDCIHSCQVVRPNPDAPLSEIVRRPATKRERSLIWSVIEHQVGGYRVRFDYGRETGGLWKVYSPDGRYLSPFHDHADALAHAEQLAEGRE